MWKKRIEVRPSVYVYNVARLVVVSSISMSKFARVHSSSVTRWNRNFISPAIEAPNEFTRRLERRAASIYLRAQCASRFQSRRNRQVSGLVGRSCLMSVFPVWHPRPLELISADRIKQMIVASSRHQGGIWSLMKIGQRKKDSFVKYEELVTLGKYVSPQLNGQK